MRCTAQLTRDLESRGRCALAKRNQAVWRYTSGVLSIMFLAVPLPIGQQSSMTCENHLRPEDFNVDFMVHWVPELPKGMRKP